MAQPLPISHEEIRNELVSISSLLASQINKLDKGIIRRAAEEGEPDGDVDPDTILRRFQREIELAGQKAITLAAAIDPEVAG